MAEHSEALTDREQEEVEKHSPPAARVIHTVVAEQGEDELARPVSSLWWSSLAAGIAMMASVSASGALDHYLPRTGGRELLVNLGYPVGFLIVIIGRLQLFTEQTVVAVLPFAKAPSWSNLSRVARLWSVVFVGNVLGAAIAAAVVRWGGVQSDEILQGMRAVSAKLLDKTPAEHLLQGIPAGFLIAAIAWIRSATTDSGFWLVLTLTYVIAICGFTHVIVGAAEASILLWSGRATLGWVVAGLLLPALIGNIIGGTGLFAVLAHAQVKEEV